MLKNLFRRRRKPPAKLCRKAFFEPLEERRLLTVNFTDMEPNSSFTAAQSLGTYSDRIDIAGTISLSSKLLSDTRLSRTVTADPDYFSFEVTTDGPYEIAVAMDPLGTQPSVTLFNESHQDLGSKSISKNNITRLEQTLSPGEYFISISAPSYVLPRGETRQSPNYGILITSKGGGGDRLNATDLGVLANQLKVSGTNGTAGHYK